MIYQAELLEFGLWSIFDQNLESVVKPGQLCVEANIDEGISIFVIKSL